MLCGATEALLTGCEANKRYLECFTCIGEENFGQARQALSTVLLKSSSTFKTRSSQLQRFFIPWISWSTWHCDGAHTAKDGAHGCSVVAVRFVTEVALLCKKKLRICISSSFPFTVPQRVTTQWVLYRKTAERGNKWQKLKSPLCILSKY